MIASSKLWRHQWWWKSVESCTNLIGLPANLKCVVTMRDGLTATPKMCGEPWAHLPYSNENGHAHAPQNSIHFRVSSDFTREWTLFSGGFSAHNLLPEIDPLSSGELSGCKDGDSLTRTRTSPKNRTSGTCTGDCKVGPYLRDSCLGKFFLSWRQRAQGDSSEFLMR